VGLLPKKKISDGLSGTRAGGRDAAVDTILDDGKTGQDWGTRKRSFPKRVLGSQSPASQNVGSVVKKNAALSQFPSWPPSRPRLLTSRALQSGQTVRGPSLRSGGILPAKKHGKVSQRPGRCSAGGRPKPNGDASRQKFGGPGAVREKRCGRYGELGRTERPADF